MFKLFLFATILAFAASAPAPNPKPNLLAPILPLTYQPLAQSYQYQNQYAPSYYYRTYYQNEYPLTYYQPLAYQQHLLQYQYL